MSPLRTTGGGGSTLNPSGTTLRVDSQQSITFNAANQYGLSAQTLWGIYGTESNFGADATTSSAGAQGPMQFEPATWAKYGGGRNVNAFDAAMPAAAKYLHDLGANGNPTSAATIAAVNAYNGNGGGSNPNTTYFQNVLSNGAQLADGSSDATTPGSVSTAQSGSSSSGGDSIGDVLSDLVSGSIGGLAATLGLAAAEGIKDLAVGAWDMVVVPLWHREQNAVWWYYVNVLFPESGSSYQAYQTWPVNAAFWGFGYALLFIDPQAPKGQKLVPTDPRRSRLARHVRRAQAAPAKRALVKPGDVKKHTPKKPKEVRSKVQVQSIGQLNTQRARPVKVTGTVASQPVSDNTTLGDNSGYRRREPARPARATRGTETGTGVTVQEQIQARALKAQQARKDPKSNAANTGRKRTPARSRVPARPPATGSGKTGNGPRPRRVP